MPVEQPPLTVSYRFKNSYNLGCSKSSPPPSLLSVTIQIQGSPENEPQGIRRVKINLHAPGCDVNSRPLGVAESRSDLTVSEQCPVQAASALQLWCGVRVECQLHSKAQ
jgi:hypothetical protein